MTLQASNFKIGTQFIIKTKIYNSIVFTIQAVHETWIDATDSKGQYNHNIFDNDNLDFYADKVIIISEPQEFDSEKLSQIKTQLVGQVSYYGDTEKERVKALAAIEKASVEFIELVKSNSLTFDGEKLSFRSRHSHQQRTVNKNGCFKTCDCLGQISYHEFLFKIAEQYYKPVILTFPVCDELAQVA